MSENRKIQLETEVVANTDGFQQIQQAAQQTAQVVQQAGEKASTGLDKISQGTKRAADSMARDSGRLTAEIKRVTLEMQTLGKTASEKFEAKIAFKGLDAAQFAPAIAQLKELERARAAIATQQVKDNFIGDLRGQISSLREAANLQEMTADQALRYKAAQAGASAEAAHLITQLTNMRAAQESAAAAAQRQAAAQREAAAAAKSRDAFIGSLRAEADAIGKTRSDLLELKAAQLGVSKEAEAYIAKLRKVEAGQAAVGVSARQTAAALRGVPAQFTDIVTSLASGQNPMIVILQQGGQLKDMFGGAGNAARALGGYVAGLVNPFTIAAAAVGVLTAAFIKGSQEATEFQKSILLSGNFAGTTAGQLQERARRISDTGGGTQGAASEALAAMAANGNIAGDSLERFARIALKMERETGQSFSETAKQFAELAKSPLEATTKLNETSNFLTANTAKRIRELQEEGRTAEAAKLAQTAYADALESRFGTLETRLDTLERSWRGIVGAAKGAWDAMLNVGRPDTLEEQLERVNRAIDKARNRPFDPSAFGGNAEARAKLSENERLKESLEGQLRLQRGNAEVEAKAVAQGKARLEFDKLREQFLTKQAKMEKEIAEARAKGAQAGASPKEIDNVVVGIRDKFSDKKVGREGDKTRQAALEAELARFRDALQEERDALAFHERQLQNQYQAGAISLTDYYDRRVEAIRVGARKTVEEMEREKARIAQDRDFFAKKDPSRAVQLQGKIDALTREQEKAGKRADRDVELANDAKAESFRQLSDEVTAYRINLAVLQGDEATAARLRANQAIVQAKRLAKKSEGSPTAISPEDQAATERAIRNAQTLTETRRQSGIVSNALALEEERIAMAQRAGAITSTEALAQSGEARKRVVAQLEEIVKAQEEVAARAENSENWQLKLDTAQARQQLEKLKEEMDPLAEHFRSLFTDATGNLFADLADNPKGAKEAIRRFASDITRQMNAEFGRDFATKLFGKEGIFGNLPGQVGEFFNKDGKKAPAPLVDTAPLSGALRALQTAGVDPTTAAFQRLTAVIDQIAATAGGQPAAGGAPALTTGDFTRMDRGQSAAQEQVAAATKDAEKSAQDLAESNGNAAASVLQLASAAARGGNALSLLPQIIQMILASAQAATTSGAGSSPFGNLGSLFGNLGTTSGVPPNPFAMTASQAVSTAGSTFIPPFASGGYTGDIDPKKVAGAVHGREYVFDAVATRAMGRETLDRMQTAARKDDPALAAAALIERVRAISGGDDVRRTAGLKPHEVPAILMGGPKGVREEVLTADDPRHKDNLSPGLARLIDRLPRYHDGGIVGEKSYLVPSMNYLTPPAPTREREEGWSGGTAAAPIYNLNVSVTAPQGASRETAMQFGATAGRSIQLALRRNG